jgi:hypothetical protein
MMTTNNLQNKRAIRATLTGQPAIFVLANTKPQRFQRQRKPTALIDIDVLFEAGRALRATLWPWKQVFEATGADGTPPYCLRDVGTKEHEEKPFTFVLLPLISVSWLNLC